MKSQSTQSSRQSWCISDCSGRQGNRRQEPKVKNCKWRLQVYISIKIRTKKHDSSFLIWQGDFYMLHEALRYLRTCKVKFTHSQRVTIQESLRVRRCIGVPVCRSATMLSLTEKYAWMLGRTPVWQWQYACESTNYRQWKLLGGRQCCHVYSRDHLTCYCVPFHVVDQVDIAKHSYGYIGTSGWYSWFFSRLGCKWWKAVFKRAIM